jgi:beta-glucosidase
MAYWPGGGGAAAIADVLAGDANPSGRLPFTYARHSNNLVTYDRKFTSAVTEISAPGDIKLHPSKPQWEFGFGLSYTTFECTSLRLSSNILRPGETLTVSVDVKNTGARAGKETVELYTSDLFASITPAGKRLRAFTKILLQPGETQTVTFPLTAADLAFVDADCRTVTEPGEFDVLIAGLTARFRCEAA